MSKAVKLICLVIVFLSFLCEAKAFDDPKKTSLADINLKIFYPALSSFQYASLDTSSPNLIKKSAETEINYGRLAVVGGTLLGGMAAIHIYQQNGWWKDHRQPFHFQEDLGYGLNVDKIGHFYGASVFAFVTQKSTEWANVPEQDALWIGAGASLLFQTYIEVEDGFSDWGFDRVDFATNVGGVLWHVGKYYLPSLQNFDLKLSYHPSPLLGSDRGIGFKGQQHLMIDDYEGQTFWLSVKVNNLIPKSLEPYWPDFLCLAVGYGARDIGTTAADPYRVYFLALDYDMTKIIPQNTGFLRTLGQALNFIHLPAPAVRISPSAIWYGLYF